MQTMIGDLVEETRHLSVHLQTGFVHVAGRAAADSVLRIVKWALTSCQVAEPSEYHLGLKNVKDFVCLVSLRAKEGNSVSAAEPGLMSVHITLICVKFVQRKGTQCPR